MMLKYYKMQRDTMKLFSSDKIKIYVLILI